MEYIHTQILLYKSRILFIQIHLRIASSVIYIGITISLYMDIIFALSPQAYPTPPKVSEFVVRDLPPGYMV